MNRRTLGAALLLLSVLVAVVVPGLSGRHVNGAPTAMLIQPPPTVGDCLLENPQVSAGRLGELAALAYGSCGRQNYGEVVQVFGTFDSFPRIQLDDDRAPDRSTCIPAADSYLGVDQVVSRNDRGDYRSVSFGVWQPVAIGSVGVIGPSAAQQLVGQQWIACVTEGNTNTPFGASVRNAFTGGTLPDSYAICSGELTAAHHTDCALPHRAELFADTGFSDDLPSQADLTSSCTDFLRYLTGRTDLSAGGRLQVVAKIVYYDPIGHPKPGNPNGSRPPPGHAVCGITATGQGALTATLFALGSRALPWS